MIHTINRHEGRTDRFESVFDPDFKAWTEQNQVFHHMAAYGSGQATLLSGSEPQRIGSAEVTMDFFSLLGVKTAIRENFCV